MQNNPLSEYTLIRDLRSGGEGKAILYEKEGIKYVCKQRTFDTLNEANQGLKEATALARVDSPNTVRFEEAIMETKDNQVLLHIFMEFCPLGDLLDFLIDVTEPMNHNHQQQNSTMDSSSNGSSRSGSVTLGSELSSMLNLGSVSEYSVTLGDTSSDIESSKSRSSSSSSTSFEHIDPIIHSQSSPNLLKNHHDQLSPRQQPIVIGSNKSNSTTTLQAPHSTFSPPLSSSLPNKSTTKCSLRERKCIIKMTKDFTKTFFKKSPSSTTIEKQQPQPPQSQQSTSQLQSHDNILHSNEIKRGEYLIEQNQLIEWLLDLAYGVQALHKANICHRDLKSENIFISASNKLKIGDFGLAININQHLGKVFRETVGTYAYSSPEILDSKSTYDKTTDIFSLGCIFYELITLKLLSYNRIFIGEDMLSDRFDSMYFLSTFPSKYEKLGPLVLSMIDKNPTFRPSLENIIQRIKGMDTSLLNETRVIVKRENNVKGIKKQLDKSHFEEASLVLANSLVHDPRFSTAFKPSDPTSVPCLQHLFKYILKVLFSSRCNIWGYFGIDGTLLSVFVWLDVDTKKQIKLSDRIKGSLSLAGKIGLKRVTKVIELFRFADSLLTSDVYNSSGGKQQYQQQQTTTHQQHWLLAYCATKEVYRGNGIGSYLCENILNWADHSQVDCRALIFNKNSLQFFQNQSFEISQEITTGLPKDIKKVWLLIRKPQNVN